MERSISMRNRIVAVALIFVMMIGCTACNFWGSIQNTIDPNTQNISMIEMARLIVSSIDSADNVSDTFVAIPEHQREGVSYSDYYEFINVLRSMVSGRGEVDSFRILKTAERKNYIASILAKSDNDTSAINKYGFVDVVELVLDREGGYSPVRFFISSKTDGMAFLSEEYIKDTVASFNYIEHYFTMIQDENASGLKAILEPSFTEDIYISSVVEAKAGLITDYYNTKVITDLNEYRYVDITPMYVSLVIPETIGDNGNDIVEHNVIMTKSRDGVFKIHDVIPFDNGINAVSIYDGTQKTISIGSDFHDDIVNQYFGECIYFREYPIEDNQEYSKAISYMYNGIVLTFYVNSSDEGVLHSARIFGSGYTIDDSVYVGMSISELLLIYPMIDEYNYKYTVRTNNNEYTVEFEFDENKNISAIKLY